MLVCNCYESKGCPVHTGPAAPQYVPPVPPDRPPLHPHPDDLAEERDRLWCEALIAVLDVDDLHRVLREFNRRRKDRPCDEP